MTKYKVQGDFKSDNQMTLYPKIIVDALSSVIYAGTKRNLVESEMLADQPVVKR